MTQAKVLFPVNEIELTYRKIHEVPTDSVNDHEDAAKILRSVWDEGRIGLQEEFKILLLDSSSHCLGVVNIASGGLDACAIDSRLVFAAALKAKATRIILAHNHPSGNTKPSEADLQMTRQLCECGDILRIPILDHLIMTDSDYTSFCAKGLLPRP